MKRVVGFLSLLSLLLGCITGASAQDGTRSRAASIADALVEAFPAISGWGAERRAAQEIDKIEPRIRDILKLSGLPGALIYVDVQISQSEVQVRSLVGDKPHLLGAGKSPLSVWLAFYASPEKQFYPQIAPGYKRDESNSKFIWARLKGDELELFENDAQLLLSEARRVRNDRRLWLETQKAYQAGLQGTIVKHLERAGATADLRERAAALLKSAEDAQEQKRKLDENLARELEKIAKINAQMDRLQLLVNAAQFANEIRVATADHPSKKDAIGNVKDSKGLEAFLQSELAEANVRKSNIIVLYNKHEDSQQKLRRETLVLFKDSKIDGSLVPGMVPGLD